MATYRILMMGASYGSLLASKMLAGGHSVHFVCLPAEAALISADGFRVRMPIGAGRDVLVDSRELPGILTAGGTDDARPEDADLVCLAMQEPQCGAPGVRDLLARVGASRVPSMAIMNIPPIPYFQRLGGLDDRRLRPAYTDPAVWATFDPAAVTLASADPQAFRRPEDPVNVLSVTLPTNFKVARFVDDGATAVLRQIADDIDAARVPTSDGPIALPVRLRVVESAFVPLAKWAMLCAGNYRSVTAAGIRTTEAAVWSDLDASRSVYEFVNGVAVAVGARREDLVPFEKYAAAARSLSRPASVARALDSGATRVERTDQLVQLVAEQKGLTHPALDAIVALIDTRLAANRRQQAC